MLHAAHSAWEISDMSDSDALKGDALYNALMRLKPSDLPETEWALQAGVNRGWFTNLKGTDRSARNDTLRKLLSHIGKTEADLYASAPARAASKATPIATHPDLAPTKTADGGETTPIVALDLSLSMGPGTPIEEFVESEPVEFDLGLLRSITRAPYHRLRIVRGIGNSMEPKFFTGDRILVDTTERTLSRIDGYYWITLWGAHGLKRLRPVGPQRVEVISENPDHDPIVVDADELTIEGRAIWFARDL